ncbi:MAG: alanine racemase [Chloroflexi bacterium]|nr:alanine racemase [Chloroflexota bacterium]
MSVGWRGRPVWAEIDLDAIAHNTRALKRLIGDKVELLAVVKANGYGHGAVMVSVIALRSGASRLGVACVDEGIQLRRAGISSPILVLGYIPPCEAAEVVRFELTPTVNTMQLALALSSKSAAASVTTPLHVKVDTGLTRFGLLPEEVAGFVKGLLTMPNLRLEGLWTHFASADEPDKEFTHRQLAIYNDTLAALARSGIAVACRHAANSAATLDIPASHLDMVRCGIGVYGMYPSNDVSRPVELRPAMTLKSKVARLRRLPPGTTVSYGRTYVTRAPTSLALVVLGYADGVRRALSNAGHVLVKGRRANIAGRVCMDQFVVDVEGIEGVQQDDEVVLMGRQGLEAIPAEEIAGLLGTINYEVTCGISARVPRVYLSNGKPIGADTLVSAARPAQFDAGSAAKK